MILWDGINYLEYERRNGMNELIEKLKQMTGEQGFYYKNLLTDKVITYREDELFGPASVIKLPILMAVFKMVSEGKASLRDKIVVSNREKMPSCGALNSFTGEPEVDVRTLCNLMITISDNTATNVLIDYYTMEVLNQVFQEMGLVNTRVNRKLFDKEASKKNIQNSVTAQEMGFLLEELYFGRFVSQEVSEDVLDILSRQQINHKMKEMLPAGTKVAHKTGEDDDISNDVGIIYGEEPCVICFLSNKTLPYVFNPFIRETCAKAYYGI